MTQWVATALRAQFVVRDAGDAAVKLGIGVNSPTGLVRWFLDVMAMTDAFRTSGVHRMPGILRPSACALRTRM